MSPLSYERLRSLMVDDQCEARGVRDQNVLEAMRKVPRHLFVDPSLRKVAYEDGPLPIGYGQTISQPFIVAVMTELLNLSSEDRVLEIGTGSGYQAAILGLICRKVISIERIPEVADMARENLANCEIRNVSVVVGDGTKGHPEGAPYNGIIITAAAPAIPPVLEDQLEEGGRLVAPVGDMSFQTLVRVEKKGGMLTSSYHGGVRFVPLIGRYGWDA